MDIDEAELNELQQKAAAFDNIYEELYRDEGTGEYTVSKKHDSSELITAITIIITSVREAPGATAGGE